VTRRGVALLAFAIAFLATRLVSWDALPVFMDEAIHLDAARDIRASGDLYALPQGGGKYLTTWLYALTAAPAENPLRVARATSAVFGLAAALGLWGLGALTGSEASGACAALLYLITPFALAYDRMAMADTPLAALVVLSLVAAFRWAQRADARHSLLLGLALGAAGLTKLYGLIAVLVPLLLVASAGERRRDLARRLPLVFAATLVVLAPMLVDLAPRAGQVAQEWIFRAAPTAAAGPWAEPVEAVAVLASYLTPPGLLLALLASVVALARRAEPDLLLLAFALLWCAVVVAGGPNWLPRYLLPAVPPLLLLVSRQAVALASPGLPIAVAATLALGAWPFDRALLTDPARAPWPALDAEQHVWGTGSGYGLSGVRDVLVAEAARSGELVVLRDRRAGPLNEGLDLLLPRRGAGIRRVGMDFLEGCLDFGEDPLPPARATLVVLQRHVGTGWTPALGTPDLTLEPIARWTKPGGVFELALFRVGGQLAPLRCPARASQR
jgi:4-amino-4-deoxy-L-arabinose transferase-like glycosyltransferase